MAKNQPTFEIPTKFKAATNVDFTKLGFRPSTDKEIAKGGAPFLFNFSKKDSPACAAAKSMYNSSSAQFFETNQEFFSPLEPFIQSLSLKHTMDKSIKTIATQCVPQNFKL